MRHLFQVYIHIHAIKLAINVGIINVMERLVMRFMMAFTLFE